VPRRLTYLAGVPCWVDHLAVDPPAAQEFYGRLFGWRFAAGDGPATGYDLVSLGDELVGGFGRSPDGPYRAASWNVYLATKDAAATCGEVERLGGTVVLAPLPVGADGRLFFAVDPAGTPVGFWEGHHEQGVVLAGEAGAMCWHELHTGDPARSGRFYGGLFDCTLTTREGGQTTYDVGGEPYAGVVPLTGPGARPHWLPYFGVADPAAWVAGALAAGARVVGMSPTRPGGSAIVLRDPWGASFGITTPLTGPPG
jgi:predicted enzyme related to lactoylglutathione lyase